MNTKTLPLPRHPHTGLQALGWTRRGPIWPVLGGSGDGAVGADSAGAAGADGDGDGDSGAGDGTGSKTPKIQGDLDPDRLVRDLGKAREDTKREKTARLAVETKSKETLDAIAVALGLKPDPKLDPTALVSQAAQDRDAALATAKAKSIELAVFRTAGKAGADPDALLDSKSFLALLVDLDPDADDFAAKVEAAARAAVKTNSALAARTKGPGRMGAEHNGGDTNTGRPTNLREAYARKTT